MLHAIALLKATIDDKLDESEELSADGDFVGAMRAGYVADDCRRALGILESNQTTETNAIPRIADES